MCDFVLTLRSSLWHVDCFRCAKCKDKVSADTNLLLLSDGSPVCGNCSYQVCSAAFTKGHSLTYSAMCANRQLLKKRS